MGWIPKLMKVLELILEEGKELPILRSCAEMIPAKDTGLWINYI